MFVRFRRAAYHLDLENSNKTTSLISDDQSNSTPDGLPDAPSDADTAAPDSANSADGADSADAQVDETSPAESADGTDSSGEPAKKKKRRRRRKKKSSGESSSGDTSVAAVEEPVAVPFDEDQDLSEHAFTKLGLSRNLVLGVARQGFENPTDIQRELIPRALAGADVIGQARTGTGKTAAFGLPIIQMADPDIAMQALVMTPTRELAVQVASELTALGRDTGIRATSIIGGESMSDQRRAVEGGVQLMVGTPGRLQDLHARGQISFKNVAYAVLDEVDRMFDIGFRDEIGKILNAVSRERGREGTGGSDGKGGKSLQTIFVSATMTEDIERLARRFMKQDAEKIMTVDGALTVKMVDQHYFTVEPWDKRSLLLMLLRREKPDTVVVFCRTKRTVAKVALYLSDKGIPASEIHGDLHQSKRNKVIARVKDGTVKVLVASDLAARGLDVEHITHVINYDVPEDPDVYVHRIGRTARAGRRGAAWSFVTSEDAQRLTDIEKLTGAMIEHWEYPKFKPGPIPRGVLEERAEEDKTRNKKTSPDQRVAGVDIDELSTEQKSELFPDGVVPVMRKRKGLGSKFKRRGR